MSELQCQFRPTLGDTSRNEKSFAFKNPAFICHYFDYHENGTRAIKSTIAIRKGFFYNIRYPQYHYVRT